MASTLKRVKLQGVGTTATALTTDTETGPAVGKVWNIPRLYLCNITASQVVVTVAHRTGTTDTRVLLSKTLAANDTLILEHVVLLNGDSLLVVSGTATSLDAFGSVLEEDA